MLSNTAIKRRLRRKTNPELAETIAKAKKEKPWAAITKILSGPTKKQASVSLSDIEKQAKAGDTLLIPGKILAQGDLTKKVRIAALSISANAKEKLKESKSEFVSIATEIKKNPKMEGVKILR